MFGAISFLIDVAEVINAAVAPADDFRETRYIDNDDSDDEAIGYPPLVDVMEEDAELIILLEGPGCYAKEVRLKVLEDILIVTDSEDRELHEVLLPKGYYLDEATRVGFNNGVTIIKFPKALSACIQRKIA